MFSFKKKTQASAEIQLTRRSNGNDEIHDCNRSWLSTEDITGYALFKLPPNVEFSHSKVALKGFVATRTDENQPGSLQRSWRTEKISFLGVTLDSKPRSVLYPGNGVVKIPFEFNLEDVRRRCPVLSDLPPSISSKTERNRMVGLHDRQSDVEYEITYNITASVFTKRGLLASTIKTVPVLPVSHSLYPDLAPGHILAANTPEQARFHFKTLSGSRIEVTGQEPEPLLLNAHDIVPHRSTEVPFVLKALPQLSAAVVHEALPTQCHLKAHLTAKTLVTPDRVEERAVPAIEQGRYPGESYLNVHKSHEQEFTVSIPPWEQYSLSSHEKFALSQFCFIFTLNGDKIPTPTFFTPLLSRRYAIDFTLSFPGVSRPSVKLSIPLQILYEEIEFNFAKAK